MALEQFKTQVLLLHSQQSTLDALGAGFNDKYSVHFATSGSEALTTLGETPIHIIVSAQELPGMSGLEALREAKKRSPDTIGILLAGDDTSDDLEALVGDQEVFQVVRGAIQPDALLKIVETATRRMRMLTLSKSANDNAANVDSSSSLADTISNLQFPEDDGTGEHIVMETMENGTSMITDGTGRLPVLKPDKIPVSPEAGGRAVDVLVLTKDSEFLDTVRESARGLHSVHHAVTGQQAQDAVRKHKVGVLVTDAALAGNKVELLTQSLRAHAPRLVAIVAGRRDDGDSLMELINRGQVYRFLLKPVSPGRARLAIEASVKYHLEAPETAFKGAASAAARPAAAAPAAKAAPAPKPAASPKPAAAARPAADKAATRPAEPAPRSRPADAPAARKRAPDAAPEASLRDTGQLEIPADKRRQSPAAADGETSGFRPSLPMIGAAAALVVVLAGGAWLMLGGEPDPAPAAVSETPAATDTTPAETTTGDAVADEAPATSAPAQGAPAETPAAAEPRPAPAYVALLDNARFARDSGRVLAPAGDNAIEWYVAARDAAPGNAVIAGELAALLEQVIGIAEQALLENRLQDAADALGMVELASPQHPRLTFLNAQVEQMQLRSTLDAARAAIRDTRFEDAGRLLTRAEAIPGADAAAIGQLAEELAAARSAQQVGDVLARAEARLADGRLVEPSNDNARYFFELALNNDPGNAAARQGLLVVASRLVLKARAAVDAGEFDAAESLLGDARTLDADNAELAATETALANAIAARAEAERQAELERQAAERAEAERLAAEARRRAAASATLSTAESQGTAAGETADLPPAQAATSAPASVPAGLPADDVASDDGIADDVASPSPDFTPASAGAASNQSGQAGQAGGEPETIAVSQLTRANYVAPRYPRNAQRRNVSGWVDVAFTVTPSGGVSDVTVMDSTPGTVFDDAATEAVSQWRFEPVIENGRPVSKRVAVRMSFDLQ